MTKDITIVDLPSRTLAMIRTSAPTDPAALGAAMGEGFGALMGGLGAAGITPQGQPMCAYFDYSDSETTFAVAKPIAAEDADKVPGNIEVAPMASGKALRLVHRGPYANLKSSYERLIAEYTSKGYQMRVPSYETYLNDPGDTDEADLLTEILMPIGAAEGAE